MERRRHPRTTLNMSVQCIRLDPDGGDVFDRIHVVDISRSGLGAVSDRSFYPGQRIILALPISKGSTSRSLYASVVRCRPRDDGYRIGLEFDATAVGAWTNDQTYTVAAA